MKALSAHTVTELKAELLKRNAQLTGKEKKAELVEKLKALLAAENADGSEVPGTSAGDAAAPSSATAEQEPSSGVTAAGPAEKAEPTSVSVSQPPASEAPAEAPAPQADVGSAVQAQADEHMAEQASADPVTAPEANVTASEATETAPEAGGVAAPEADGAKAPEVDGAIASGASGPPVADANGAAAKAAAAEPVAAAKPVEKEYGPEEWEKMPSIPEIWRPLPILRVKNVLEGTTSEQLVAAFEEIGVTVHSVAIDDATEPADKAGRVALVRLPAPVLPWNLTDEDLKTHPLDSTLKAAPVVEPAPIPAVAEAAAELASAAAPDTEMTDSKDPDETVAPAAEAVSAAATAADAAGDVAAATVAATEDINPAGGTEAATPAKAAASPAKAAAAPATTPTAMPVTTPAKGKVAGQAQVPQDDGRKEGDVLKVARYYAARITNVGLSLDGTKLPVDAPIVQATLFLGNLPEDDEDKLRSDLEKYGPIERCYIMRNAEGLSKRYGFVEFKQPTHAAKAHSELEAAFNKAHRDAQQQRFERKKAAQAAARTTAQAAAAPAQSAAAAEPAADAEMTDAKAAPANGIKTDVKDESAAEAEVKAEPAAEVKAEENGAADEKAEPKIADAKSEAAAAADGEEDKSGKILRAEFSQTRTVASLFSHNLYIANVKEGLKDDGPFRSAFEEFGPLTTCQVAKGPMGFSRGYAFVEYKRSEHADAAFHALDDVDNERLGHVLISFVNPAKDRRPSQAAQQQRTPTPYARGTQYASSQVAGGRGGAQPGAHWRSPYSSGRGPAAYVGGRGAGTTFAGGYAYNTGRGGAPGNGAGSGYGGAGSGYGPVRGAAGGGYGISAYSAGGGYGFAGNSAGRSAYAAPPYSQQPAAPPRTVGYAQQANAGAGFGRIAGSYVASQLPAFAQTVTGRQADTSSGYGSGYGTGSTGGYGVQAVRAAYTAPAASTGYNQASAYGVQTANTGYAAATPQAGYSTGVRGASIKGYGQQAATAGYGIQDQSQGYGQQAATGGYASSYSQQPAYATATTTYNTMPAPTATGYGVGAVASATGYGMGYGVQAQQQGYSAEPDYKRMRY